MNSSPMTSDGTRSAWQQTLAGARDKIAILFPGLRLSVGLALMSLALSAHAGLDPHPFGTVDGLLAGLLAIVAIFALGITLFVGILGFFVLHVAFLVFLFIGICQKNLRSVALRYITFALLAGYVVIAIYLFFHHPSA